MKVDMNRFALFCDQQEKFKRALLDYDPNVWFPRLRGSLEESNSGNWFLCFVPARWGRWKGAVYGVHFDFMYGRPRGRLPERIRFVIGVEKPLLASHRQGFKEDVIARIGQTGDVLSGFALKARDRAKLLESDPIPFNDEAWRIALGLYVDLQPVVQIIGDLSEEYYRRGAYEIPIEFPR